MAITLLPTPPQRSDPANFATRADAFLTALPTFGVEANAVAVDVNSKQTTASAAAVAAAASQVAASASEVAAANSSGATIWVSGTTYALGNVRFSPTNFVSYRRKTAGSGTTDPLNDPTNWAPITADPGANTNITSLTNLSSINGGQLGGLRNRVINGSMKITQRGNVTVPLGSFNSYTLDRWASYQTGAALPVSQGGGNGLDQQFALLFFGAAGNTETTFFQCIESANGFDLAQTGMTISVSLYSTVAKTISLNLDTANTTDTFGSTTTPLPSGGIAFSHPGNGWQKTSFAYSAALSQANATAIQRGIRVRISFGACTTGTFAFTGVQLEAGITATPFSQRSYGLELSLCQRYTRPITPVSCIGQCTSTTNATLIVPGSPMRATPSLSSTSGFAVTNATGGNITTTAISIFQICADGQIILAVTVASGLVAGNAAYFNTAGSSVVFSAEL